jgi:hypothetical protein
MPKLGSLYRLKKNVLGRWLALQLRLAVLTRIVGKVVGRLRFLTMAFTLLQFNNEYVI